MQCPICKKPVQTPADPTAKNPYPFCSERCRLIDLGRWLGGKYQIPVVTADDPDSAPPNTHDGIDDEEK